MSSPQNPIFQSIIFTYGYVEKYRGTILAGEGVIPITDMMASGIPQNVCILYEIEQLKAGNAAVKAEMQKMKEDIIEAVTHSSNCRPEKLVANLVDNFTINGMTPVTVDCVQSIVTEIKIGILSALERKGNSLSEEKYEETSCSPHLSMCPLVSAHTFGATLEISIINQNLTLCQKILFAQSKLCKLLDVVAFWTLCGPHRSTSLLHMAFLKIPGDDTLHLNFASTDILSNFSWPWPGQTL